MTQRRIPDLVLERFALGELDGARRAEITAQIEEDPELAERLEAIEKSTAELLAAMPPRVFAARVDALANARPATRNPMWAFALPLVSMAVAVFIAVPVAIQMTSGPEIEVVRSKGDPTLQVHRQGLKGPEPMRSGGTASPGDLLQLSYTAAGAEFGAILSVDGHGNVTQHLPRKGHQSVKLQPGAGVPLDHAGELDDAPDFERFVFVTGPDVFGLAEVKQALRGTGMDEEIQLDAPLQSTFFQVRKEAP